MRIKYGRKINSCRARMCIIYHLFITYFFIYMHTYTHTHTTVYGRMVARSAKLEDVFFSFPYIYMTYHISKAIHQELTATLFTIRARARARACVCARARVCVRVCVCVCVRVCVYHESARTKPYCFKLKFQSKLKTENIISVSADNLSYHRLLKI